VDFNLASEFDTPHSNSYTRASPEKMGLHAEMKRLVVAIAVQYGGEGGFVWPTPSHRYAVGSTASITDYLTSFRAMNTEKTQTLESLTTHMVKWSDLGFAVTICAVDDKRNVPVLKASEQQARVEAADKGEAKKGLEKAVAYPDFHIFTPDDKICLRRIQASHAVVKRSLWQALEPMYLDVVSRRPDLQLCIFDWNTDSFKGVRREVVMHPCVPIAPPPHVLGEADLDLVYRAHQLAMATTESNTMAAAHLGGQRLEINTIVLNTTDSDIMLLAAFYMPHLPEGVSLHWSTGHPQPRDKKKKAAPATSKKQKTLSAEAIAAEAWASMDREQPVAAEPESAAAASAVLTLSSPKSSSSKRKTLDAATAAAAAAAQPKDEVPMSMDLQAALGAMCREYKVDFTELGEGMALAGNDFIFTAHCAFFKGLKNILDAYFGLCGCLKPQVLQPSFRKYKLWLRMLWQYKKGNNQTIEQLRDYYAPKHAAAIAAMTGLTEAEKATQRTRYSFPSDAVIEEQACIWIYTCSYCANAYLGVKPTRTLHEILVQERAMERTHHLEELAATRLFEDCVSEDATDAMVTSTVASAAAAAFC
jgi:hypothetical protein